MKIVNVGYNFKHPKVFSINRPFGSGDYILLVVRTPAFFILNQEKQVINSNCIVVYKKGTPQIYGATEDEYINDWIHFEADENDIKMIEELGVPLDTIIDMNDVTLFSSLIKNMFYEKYSENFYKNESSNLYLKLILIKISERIKWSSKVKTNVYFKELSDVRNQIYSMPEKDWNVDTISKHLTLSKSYFQHMYKECFGVNVMSDIINSRMEYAKYLLFSTDLSICIISQMCGYKNDVHFMRMFKKNTGSTPSEYRKKTKISEDEVEKSKKHNPFCFT